MLSKGIELIKGHSMFLVVIIKILLFLVAIILTELN